MISYFDLLISWLPDIVQKCFCTQERSMDPTLYVYLSYRLGVKHKKNEQDTHMPFFGKFSLFYELKIQISKKL